MLRTDNFDFELPKDLIAQNPVFPRDTCRLLAYNSNTKDISHGYFFDILDFFTKDDVLVLNSTKVIPARILFKNNSGRVLEIFLLESVKENLFRVLVKPGKFFKKGVKFNIHDIFLATVVEVFDDGSRLIHFESNGDFYKNLDRIGSVPLPPYIKSSNSDFDDYQTVFADKAGSVAAPTAGLHFTNELLHKLREKGVKIINVVLHVGQGTFSPVVSEYLADHKMHFEKYIIDSDAASVLNEAVVNKNRIIAVGTTTVRTLESNFSKYNSFQPETSETDIFIYPGQYEWKVVDSLITNFHLPKSTLLMLVASFLEHKGSKDPLSDLKAIYQTAINEKYRFFSFGDATFIY